MEVKEFQMKVCLLGDSAAGKTSLIRRFVADTFDDKYITTVGTKITRKVLDIRLQEGSLNASLDLMIWDIVGQKTFENLHKKYFRGSHGAMLVCDITRRDTMDSLDQWVNALYGVEDRIPVIFLANKCDIIEQAAFSKKDMARAAEKYGMPFLYTSARTGENVEEAFQALGRMLLAAYD